MGLVVTAIAGGALLGIAAAVGLRLLAIERRSERRDRVDTAVRLLLAGVETFRQECMDRPPEPGQAADEPADSAVEVRAKAHLRLMTERPRYKAPRRDGSRPSRPVRSASARRS
jgi:hypothetical protein